jgi:hypothetical protein
MPAEKTAKYKYLFFICREHYILSGLLFESENADKCLKAGGILGIIQKIWGQGISAS